ncbi:Rad24p PWA37_004925 [Arxiozyma heterogenica]|uniref:Checkpoint protein RAD24-like helical bundle domain-containing protein n=1 Tax=Arxiozyma heterogenica TaxID=278026 RepID=A0AAN7WFX7_9SACH|nr:hypothetical protein RI543_004957 [Kazachstania heterogenica]
MSSLFRSSSSFLESQTKLWESVQSTQNEREKSLLNSNTKMDSGSNNSYQKTISQNKNVYGSNIYDKENGTYDNSLQWYDKYSPIIIDEVSVHKKKIKDVEQVLSDMLSNYNEDIRIMLLTGPSGCGKSTLIKILSEKLVPLYRYKHRNENLDVINNNTNENSRFRQNYVIEYENSLELNELNHVESFNDFLQRSKYFNGIYNLSILLVEDLPNVFHLETRLQFQSIIKDWLSSVNNHRLPPLIICLTECEIANEGHNINITNTYNAETIFSREILNHPRLKRIKFNPVNNTLMKKLLNIIALNEQLMLKENNKWGLKDQYIQTLLESNNGDIRSMISSFQFWATSKGDIKTVDNSVYIRNESISFFHSIGKIIYGSHDKVGNLIDDNEMINKLLHNSSYSHNTISSSINNNKIHNNNSSTSFNDNFKLGLLENYGSFNKGQFPIEVASEIVMSLSENDSLFYGSCSLEGLEYMIRKIRNQFNSYSRNIKCKPNGGNDRVHGDFMFPRDWKCYQKQQQVKVESTDYQNVSFYKYNESVLMKDIVLYLGYYSPLIRKQYDYRMKAIQYYLKGSGKIDKNNENKNGIISNIENIEDVEDKIDLLERIGGLFKFNYNSSKNIKSEEDIKHEIERNINNLLRKRDEKLQVLIQRWEQKNMFESDAHKNDLYNEDYLDDSLVDSEQEDLESLLDDEDESKIYEILSQQKPKKGCELLGAASHSESINDDNEEDMLSDSDLENLF